MEGKCPQCGATTDPQAKFCKYCGQALAPDTTDQASQAETPPPPTPPPYTRPDSQQYQYAEQPTVYLTDKNKVAAGVLAILLGGIGVHKFYLGHIGKGVIYVLFCWTGIPSIIGLIEGIIYLTATDEKFARDYVKH